MGYTVNIIGCECSIRKEALDAALSAHNSTPGAQPFSSLEELALSHGLALVEQPGWGYGFEPGHIQNPAFGFQSNEYSHGRMTSLLGFFKTIHEHLETDVVLGCSSSEGDQYFTVVSKVDGSVANKLPEVDPGDKHLYVALHGHGDEQSPYVFTSSESIVGLPYPSDEALADVLGIMDFRPEEGESLEIVGFGEIGKIVDLDKVKFEKKQETRAVSPSM